MNQTLLQKAKNMPEVKGKKWFNPSWEQIEVTLALLRREIKFREYTTVMESGKSSTSQSYLYTFNILRSALDCGKISITMNHDEENKESE